MSEPARKPKTTNSDFWEKEKIIIKQKLMQNRSLLIMSEYELPKDTQTNFEMAKAALIDEMVYYYNLFSLGYANISDQCQVVEEQMLARMDDHPELAKIYSQYLNILEQVAEPDDKKILALREMKAILIFFQKEELKYYLTQFDRQINVKGKFIEASPQSGNVEKEKDELTKEMLWYYSLLIMGEPNDSRSCQHVQQIMLSRIATFPQQLIEYYSQYMKHLELVADNTKGKIALKQMGDLLTQAMKFPKFFTFAKHHVKRSEQKAIEKKAGESKETKVTSLDSLPPSSISLTLPNQTPDAFNKEKQLLQRELNRYYNLLVSGEPNDSPECESVQRSIVDKVKRSPHHFIEFYSEYIKKLKTLKNAQSDGKDAIEYMYDLYFLLRYQSQVDFTSGLTDSSSSENETDNIPESMRLDFAKKPKISTPRSPAMFNPPKTPTDSSVDLIDLKESSKITKKT